MMRKGKEVSLSDELMMSILFYPKVAPNLSVPTLIVLNSQESGSLKNYADHKDEGKQVLENLRLCGQETDLSDQVFKDNDQLQQDEVLALESLYGEKIFILDNKSSGLRSFQIHIHIELPEELTISTKLNTITNRFDKEIILGPYGGKDHGDPRAISGCVSADVDIPSLKRYNEEQRIESFLTNLQEYCICFSEFADLIKRLLGDEKFEKWESLTLQKTLESMTDVVYCPRCETP
ncbi:NDR1/HIN1-like 8 [Tanacetum coccineum]